jgi:hypothetical protein
VDQWKLGCRLSSIPPRHTILANSWKLTDLEENVLIEYIHDLTTKGSPPRLCVVEDIANCIPRTHEGHLGL